MISVITPWHNQPQLIDEYERAVRGLDVVIVDNASSPSCGYQLARMAERLGGTYLRNARNFTFSRANNIGMKWAKGDVLLFLNNDIVAGPGWYKPLEKCADDAALYGAAAMIFDYADVAFPYLEGWCLAGARGVWENIGGWPDFLPGNYADDVYVALRAHELGIPLQVVTMGIRHLSNTTSRVTPGAYDHAESNRRLVARLAYERGIGVKPERG